MEKYKVSAFDFDGTLIRKDSLILFFIFVFGLRHFVTGLLYLSPMLIAYKLGFLPNWKAKEKMFCHFFKGMEYSVFKRYGQNFYDVIKRYERHDIVSILKNEVLSGDRVYVISASIEEWIRPWAEREGVYDVIATKIEVDKNGRLTGKFLTPNCYGKEKVRRLQVVEPNRENYVLFSYGDSDGDRDIFEYSDKSFKV